MSSAPSPQIDHQHQLLISHVSRLHKDLQSNFSNKLHVVATSSFAYNPVVVQQPALSGSDNFFDFRNAFKPHNRDELGKPAIPKQGLDYDAIFKLLGVNAHIPKVPVINSVIPRSVFNFSSIFTNQFGRGSGSLNPFVSTTIVIKKPTVPNVVKVPASTPPVIKKRERNPDSIEEIETSAEIPEGDIDTSVDIFKPVVVAPNRNSTKNIPKKRTNYNPETGERIDTSVETFRPVSKNTVPTIIYNDKLKQDPASAEFLNKS